MNTIQLSASTRKEKGTSSAKQLRKAGMVPCVLYGGEEVLHLTMDERQFQKVLYTPETFLIELDVDGTTHKCIIQDLQFHPISDKVTHADFLIAQEGKTVVVHIPVRLNGQARGVLNGGTLRKHRRKMKLEGLVADIPEAIELDISDMKIGDSVKVGEIKIKGCKLLGPQDQPVVAIKAARGAIEDELEDEEGEEGAEGAEGAEGSAEGGDGEAQKEAAPEEANS